MDLNKGDLTNTTKQIVKVLKTEDESINDKKRKLTDEYLQCYDKIEKCLVKSNTSIKERGECMDQALDMLIRAQDNNISCKSLVGDNEKRFCQDLINSKVDKSFIRKLCIELFKIPFTATIAVLLYALAGITQGNGIRNIYDDISILNAFAPVLVFCIVGNVLKYRIITDNDDEDVISFRLRLINVLQFMIPVIAYFVMEDSTSIESYATTFERCIALTIIAALIGIIIVIITGLGGYEIIYRKYVNDIQGRNYELILYGFAKEFIKRNERQEKNNAHPYSVRDYAREIIRDVKLSTRILPVVIVVLCLEVFLLGFVVLGVGVKIIIVTGIIFTAIAIAICTVLLLTQNARRDIFERIVDGELKPDEFVDYVKESGNKTDTQK